jgi:hypothetical protein
MNQPITLPSAPVDAGNEQPRCPNCREPLLGEFCYACGQPKKGFIRHLSGIIGDFLDTVFNIDSRTLRTLFPLFFRPGFLSIEYFEGRRVRYVTPLRLYFFFSVLAFLAVSWVTHVEKSRDGDGYVDDVISAEKDPEYIQRQRKAAIEGLEKVRPFMGEEGFKEASTALDQRFDAMLAKADKSKPDIKSPPRIPIPGGSIAAPQPPAVGGRTVEPELGRKPRAARDDETGDRPLKIQFGDGDSWDPLKQPVNFGWLNEGSNAWLTQLAQRVVKNAKLVEDDPGRFVAKAFSLAPQTLFVILPLFALMLKGFYIFKRRLYMEHLIVALHSHSFLCLSILLLAGINALQSGIAAASAWQTVLGVINFCIWCWIPIYLLIAQKRIYRQGWLMTLIKYFLIGNVYAVMIGFGVVVNMMLSLVSL